MSENKDNIEKKAFLRLVVEDKTHAKLSDELDFQLALFPEVDSSVMSFFHAAFLKQNSLLNLICQVKPALVFDVRAVPSFRSFDLDRKEALGFFEREAVDYIDVAGFIGSRSFSHSAVHSVSGFVCNYIAPRNLQGPVILIFDNFELMSELAEEIPLNLELHFKRNFRAQVFVGERLTGS